MSTNHKEKIVISISSDFFIIRPYDREKLNEFYKCIGIYLKQFIDYRSKFQIEAKIQFVKDQKFLVIIKSKVYKILYSVYTVIDQCLVSSLKEIWNYLNDINYFIIKYYAINLLPQYDKLEALVHGSD